MIIVMDSGGSPENCKKHVQNRPFRGTLGKSSKIHPREAQNRTQMSKKYFCWTHFTISWQHIVQKRGGGRRPPPLFWERPEAATILLSKNSISVAQRTFFWHFLWFWGSRGRFFEDFPRVPRTRRFWIFLRFLTILRGPSVIHQNTIFWQFSMDSGFYRICRGRPIAIHASQSRSIRF